MNSLQFLPLKNRIADEKGERVLAVKSDPTW